MNQDDDQPTASPGPRNRHPDEAVPGTDPVVTRLRAALDELTTGVEPNADHVMSIAARPRRWVLPAVAAAAVAMVVGVAVAVVGRSDGGTPAAPSPTGDPVAPATTPRPLTIPWYGLSGEGGVTTTPPIDVDPAESDVPHVWASPDYSRVLVATAAATPDASATPDDWPVVREVAGAPSGVAWAFSGDAPTASWHGIYWAPDDRTSVVLTGVGFTPDDLAQVLPALGVEHDDAGPRVVSALSSLVPLPDGTRGFYTAPISASDVPVTDGYGASLNVSASGAAFPLAFWGPVAKVVRTMTTPFGLGIRIETDGPTHVWWQVENGPFWAGLTAPPDQIDDLLSRVTRVADIPAPGPPALPDGSPVAATAPPETTLAPTAPEVVSVTSAAVPPTWEVDEPAMTAAMPSSPGGDGQPPIAVGESVMGSAAEALSARGIQVHVDQAIQAVGIAEELEELRSIGAFGDVVIVQTGTNGTVSEAELERIMSAVADVDRVVVLTAHADRPWIAPNNELIRALPDRYPNVVVVDWDQIATTCDCLTSDGIHVEDRDVYADAIAAAAGLG